MTTDHPFQIKWYKVKKATQKCRNVRTVSIAFLRAVSKKGDITQDLKSYDKSDFIILNHSYLFVRTCTLTLISNVGHFFSLSPSLSNSIYLYPYTGCGLWMQIIEFEGPSCHLDNPPILNLKIIFISTLYIIVSKHNTEHR
jgi:hypothetical protein